MISRTELMARNAYLDLVKRSITNYHYLGGDTPFEAFRCVNHYDLQKSKWKIDDLARPLTLLTAGQLNLIENAVLALEQRKVPGDYIEAGIWRGGVIVFLRALLGAYGIQGRRILAADSFAGIPKNVRVQNDPVDGWSDRWVATLDEVKANISRFGLLDGRIEFVVGFFADSLPALAGRQYALIRLDSDSYESVETSLAYLYPMLSHSGIVIIDDWHIQSCKKAVMDYREKHGITAPIRAHEGNAFWVKGEIG
jgi:O-methyltransferase